MYVNLNINDLVLLLRDSTELTSLLSGWITAEKPYYEQEPPYAYIEEVVLPASNIFVRHVISVFVVMWNEWTDKEFKEIINAFDNALLAPIDWCLPIKEVGDVILTDVSKWRSTQKFRYTEKWNLVLMQDYYFDTSTVK